MITNNKNGVYNYNHAEPTEEEPLKENKSAINNSGHQPSFGEKLYNIFANITVEPCLFLFVVATLLNAMTSLNLQLEKACRVNLNYSNEICNYLRSPESDGQNEYERATQKLVANVLVWKSFIMTTLPCIFALFVGSFSDRTGHRKIFLIISIAGQILVGVNNILNIYYFFRIYLGTMVFSESIIDGLTGGWCICILTCFAYISTITTNKNRTFRMGLLSFSITVAFPIALGLSGILLKKVGYYGMNVLCTSLHIMNLLYVILMVKDPKKTNEQKKHEGLGFNHLLNTFFNFTNVRDTVSVLVRDAPNNRRLRLCILLFASSLLFGPMYGEVTVLYMSVRYRFGWDEVKYSFFQSYNFITHSIGTTFSIMIFSKYLKWHDSLLGIVSILSKIAASFVYCFAKSEGVLYLAPLIDLLNGTSFLAMRSTISKLVEPDELGKLSSLVGLIENLVPLVYVPLYLEVYSSTMEQLPGAAFLVGSLLMLPAVGVFSWLFYEHRQKLAKRTIKQTDYMKAVKV